jgi:hypothetical protein
MRVMMQRLLADRFALKVHREQRQAPITTWSSRGPTVASGRISLRRRLIACRF